MTPSRANVIGTALRRGLRKRCPHCGEGQLFSGRSHLERCAVCGLVFARNPGDTWAFTIIGDRLPMAAMIAVIYFGVGRSRPLLGLTMLAALMALLVWTSPNRWGAGIALHYVSRVYMRRQSESQRPAIDVERRNGRIARFVDARVDAGRIAVQQASGERHVAETRGHDLPTSIQPSRTSPITSPT